MSCLALLVLKLWFARLEWLEAVVDLFHRFEVLSWLMVDVLPLSCKTVVFWRQSLSHSIGPRYFISMLRQLLHLVMICNLISKRIKSACVEGYKVSVVAIWHHGALFNSHTWRINRMISTSQRILSYKAPRILYNVTMFGIPIPLR